MINYILRRNCVQELITVRETKWKGEKGEEYEDFWEIYSVQCVRVCVESIAQDWITESSCQSDVQEEHRQDGNITETANQPHGQH